MSTATHPPFTLRPATAEDRDFLLELYGSTRAEELALTGWTDTEKQSFVRMQFDAQTRAYATYESAEQCIVLVAGERAGRLYVDRRLEEIRIVDIALAPAHRGHGIGSRLLGDLILESKREQKPLTIHVERFNRALRLYERLGFRMAEDKGVYLLMERRP